MNKFYSLAAGISFAFCAFMPVIAQEIGIGQWRDHLPYSTTTAVEEFKDYIFCSTPYSLFFYDRADNSVHKLSKVNGLSDLGVSDISRNSDQDMLVVAYENTNLDLIDENFVIINIPDIKRKEILGNKTINSILNYGKYAYLSCGFGIVVVDLERTEIKDTYFIGPEGSSINVLEMTLNDTAFFAATEQGIYCARIDNPNLAYYANWKKMEGIPFQDGFFNHIHYFNDKLLINHYDPEDPEDDLYYLDNDEWKELDSTGNSRTYQIRTSGDKLVISYSYYLYIYNSNLEKELKIYTYGESSPKPADAFIGSDDIYWIADRNAGLAKVWGGGYEHEFILPSGAPTADIFNISIENGDLWLVPGGISGTWGNTWLTAKLFSFIDEKWTTYDPYNTPAFDTIRDMVCVTVDALSANRVFVGSWTRGLLQLDNNALTQVYNTENSSLGPNLIEGMPVIKVGGTAFDSEHNLWVTNSGAENILSERREDGTSAGEWQNYNLGTNTTGIDVRQILIDDFDQKWILPRTTQSNPYYIFVFNENNPPGNQSRGLKSGQGFGNLPGTNVYSFAKDLEGEIWVGTDEGIAVFYSPENILSGENSDAQRILVNFDGYTQYLLETEIVKTIAIDGANHKWIGTERAGVFLLSADGTEQIFHFTEENSPLLSNSITCIAIDEKTGEVFIGTAKGLISYKSTATEGGDTNTDVYAYPNPVRPGYYGPIAIKGLVRDASVKITDVNGVVVYETRAEGGQAIWNGHNFDGRRANSGVYLVFITDTEGKEKMVTKILFVN